MSDSKIEVIDLDEEEEFIYDARITVYEGKTYLHIRDKNDQEIYELMSSQTQQPYGSVR